MSELTAYDKFIQQALKYGFSLFGLPPTGQTTSYVAGDDGEYKKGYPRSGPRFVNNGNGTITDKATGLMWVADPSAAGVGGVYAWSNALTACEGLTYAGHSDWRLPNTKELMSIADYSRTDPAIDTNFFTSLSSYYWSSTTHAANSAYAWYGLFSNGLTQAYTKSGSIYIRPVRGGA